MSDSLIPIFIGYDYRERAATNVLIDSLYQKSSAPLSITPLVNAQLIKKKYYFEIEILSNLQIFHSPAS